VFVLPFPYLGKIRATSLQKRAAWIRMEECQDLVPIEHSEIIDRPEDDGGRNDKRVGCVSRPPCDGGERCGKVGIRLGREGALAKDVIASTSAWRAL
jgi:hypothetical protein